MQVQQKDLNASACIAVESAFAFEDVIAPLEVAVGEKLFGHGRMAVRAAFRECPDGVALSVEDIYRAWQEGRLQRPLAALVAEAKRGKCRERAARAPRKATYEVRLERAEGWARSGVAALFQPQEAEELMRSFGLNLDDEHRLRQLIVAGRATADPPLTASLPTRGLCPSCELGGGRHTVDCASAAQTTERANVAEVERGNVAEVIDLQMRREKAA